MVQLFCFFLPKLYFAELLKLNLVQSEIDPALFYWLNNVQLQGIFLMHVDDHIWSNTSIFGPVIETKKGCILWFL